MSSLDFTAQTDRLANVPPGPGIFVVGAPHAPAPLLIDAKRCAELLGISKRTWERLVEQGEAPERVKLGGRLARWRVSDVLAYVAQLGASGRPSQEPGARRPPQPCAAHGAESVPAPH
jgi:excisionase family DNA binding protein